MTWSNDDAPLALVPGAQPQAPALQEDLSVPIRMKSRPRYEGRKEFGLYVVIDHGPQADSIPRAIVEVAFGSHHPDPGRFVREEADRLNADHYSHSLTGDKEPETTAFSRGEIGHG